MGTTNTLFQMDPDTANNLSNFGFATMAASQTPGITMGAALGRGGLGMIEAAQQRAQTQNTQAETTGRNLQNALSLLPINQLRSAYGQQPITMKGVQNLLPDINTQQSDNTQSNSQPSSNTAYMPTSPSAGLHSMAPVTTTRPSANITPSGTPDNQAVNYTGTPPQPDFLSTITSAKPNTPDGRNAGQGLTQPLFPPTDGRNAGQGVYGTPQSTLQTGADAYRRILQVANGVAAPLNPQEAAQALPFANNQNVAAYLKEWAATPAHIYEKMNTPMDVREGGAVINPSTGSAIFQSPIPVDAVDSAGNKYKTWQTPAMNGNAPAANPYQQNGSTTPNTFDGRNAGQGLISQLGTITELAPGARKQIEGLMTDFTGQEHKAYQAAQVTGGQVAQMRQYFDTLNQNGWSSTGAGADARLGLAKSVNGLETALNVKPGDLSFDPTAIASSEGLYKQTKLMGMQLTNQYFGGAREAASTIQSATSAVPNTSNTYTGAKMLLNGIEESAAYQKDLYNFKTQWAQNNSGDLRGADNAFNKQNPPEAYAQRAISHEQPIRVNNASAYNRLLPGTVYKAPDGTTRIIPAPQQIQ